jgi:hypothetical protein
MNPIEAEAARVRIDRENEIVLSQSRELIKLISGGKRAVEPPNFVEFDATEHLDKLFAIK